MKLARRYCLAEKTYGPAVYSSPNHVMHFLLSIVTASLWLWFVWLPLAIFGGSYQCQNCGGRTTRTAVGAKFMRLVQGVGLLFLGLLLLLLWQAYQPK